MYAEFLLTIISVQLFILMYFSLKIVKFFSSFNPQRLVTQAAREVVENATSKYTIKKVENNMLPFVAKVVVVKVATYFLIRYIGKKIR